MLIQGWTGGNGTRGSFPCRPIQVKRARGSAARRDFFEGPEPQRVSGHLNSTTYVKDVNMNCTWVGSGACMPLTREKEKNHKRSEESPGRSCGTASSCGTGGNFLQSAKSSPGQAEAVTPNRGSWRSTVGGATGRHGRLGMY